MDAKPKLWQYREFWTVVVDLAVSAALYFGGKYLAESAADDLKWAILALQPITGLLVAYFATERINVETKKVGTEVRGVMRALARDRGEG